MVRLFTFLFLILKVSAYAQIPAYIPREGLVAWYPFSCNAHDLSEYRNDAAVFEASATADRFGNANSAYYFDGVNNYISAPAIPALDFTNKLSISVWVKLDDNRPGRGGDPIRVILGRQRNATQEGFSLIGVQGICFYSTNGSATTTIDEAADTLSAGMWHNVIATYDGSIMNLYKDGNLVHTATFAVALKPSSQPLFIGKEGTLKRNFKGSIDDVALWDRPLTAAEVTEVYAGTGAITGPGAVSVGKTIQLGTALRGGVWKSSSATIATVSDNGLVTGVSGGRAMVWYAIPNECGSSMVMAQMPLRVSITPVKEDIPVAEKKPRTPENTPGKLPVISPAQMPISPAIPASLKTRTITAEAPPAVICESIALLPVKPVKTHVVKTFAETVTVPEIIIPEPVIEPQKHEPSEAFTVSADLEREELTINTEAGAFTSYTITTTTGKLMIKQPVKSPRTIADISLLPPGSYYMMLEKDGHVKTTMFVKDK